MNEIRQNTKGNDLIRLLYAEKRGPLSNCVEVHALPEKLEKCSLQMKRSKQSATAVSSGCCMQLYAG